MAAAAKRFSVSAGAHGSKVIVERGLCIETDISTIESGVCARFDLVAIPGASGVVLKALDGSSPTATSVSLFGHTTAYSCVKVGAVVNPFARQQAAASAYGAHYIYQYEITWQQVGSVA